jgi:hypothetical protein
MTEKPRRPERSYTVEDVPEADYRLSPGTLKDIDLQDQVNYERLVEIKLLLRRLYYLKKQIHAQMMVGRRWRSLRFLQVPDRTGHIQALRPDSAARPALR